MKATSYHGTENDIQNYCVTFTHNFNHLYSRIKNSFVIKAATVTPENALKIAEILFPNFTDIKIESVENDEMTLAPSEYGYLVSQLRDKLYLSRHLKDVYVETDEDKYLLKLIQKMEARMEQFPVYHT